jgi:hypothetical protein
LKKVVQKDRPLPLKAVPADELFKRKGSRFWQARFRDGSGKLYRRTTARTDERTARQWMTLAKQEANRLAESDTSTNTHDTESPELF